mmetsp:Transcript_25008/g.45841  ORF Transcript_25008/g.45841 Transcript_25008/m.45841 type:complete len:745 (+) Transcript_25008:83-2317(+)
MPILFKFRDIGETAQQAAATLQKSSAAQTGRRLASPSSWINKPTRHEGSTSPERSLTTPKVSYRIVASRGTLLPNDASQTASKRSASDSPSSNSTRLPRRNSIEKRADGTEKRTSSAEKTDSVSRNAASKDGSKRRASPEGTPRLDAVRLSLDKTQNVASQSSSKLMATPRVGSTRLPRSISEEKTAAALQNYTSQRSTWPLVAAPKPGPTLLSRAMSQEKTTAESLSTPRKPQEALVTPPQGCLAPAAPSVLAPVSAPVPSKVEVLENLEVWQDEVDTLDKQQTQIQNDQMNLLLSQIHILTRELGQLQKDFGSFHQNVAESIEEIRVEANTAQQEARSAWDEAMDDGLSKLAEEHARSLEEHASAHARALEEHTSMHSASLTNLEDAHSKRYALVEEVHGNLQQELAELRSGNAVDLKRVVEEVTEQIDRITMSTEQLAKDVAAQEAAHTGFRLELTDHANNIGELKAYWDEAHNGLSVCMEDQISSLEKQHAEYVSTTGSSIIEMVELHRKHSDQQRADLQKGLKEVHTTLQQELQQVITDVTAQVDKLILKMEDLAKDLNVAQEEAHSALRSEFIEHITSAEEMKAAWIDAHNALASAVDDQLSNLAEEHTKSLDEYACSHSNSLEDIESRMAAEFAKCSEDHQNLHNMHNEKYAQHAAALEKGLDRVLERAHGKLQEELAELRSGHAINLRQVLEDVTTQVDTLTVAVENAGILRRANTARLDSMFNRMRSAMNVKFQG